MCYLLGGYSTWPCRNSMRMLKSYHLGIYCALHPHEGTIWQYFGAQRTAVLPLCGPKQVTRYEARRTTGRNDILTRHSIIIQSVHYVSQMYDYTILGMIFLSPSI